MTEKIISVSDFAKNGDRMLRLSEAARMIDVHPVTLKRIHQRGEIKLIKINSRKWAVWLSELRRYTGGEEAAA